MITRISEHGISLEAVETHAKARVNRDQRTDSILPSECPILTELESNKVGSKRVWSGEGRERQAELHKKAWDDDAQGTRRR